MIQLTLQKAVHAARREYASSNNSNIEDTPALSSLKSFRSDSDEGWLVVDQLGSAFAMVGDCGTVELL